MTTSSDHRKPTPEPNGDHWLELTATLSNESTQAFGDWLGRELETMVAELDEFVTPGSRRKSFGR